MSGKQWPEGAWSHSQFEKLRACPRRHKLAYRNRLQLIGHKLPLEIGKTFHRVLEAVGIAVLRGKESTPEVWENAVRAAREKTPLVDAGIEATRLVAAYAQHYGHDNAGYGEDLELLATEETLMGGELHQAIGGFASIADAHLIERATGDHVIFEHKTAGKTPYGSDEELSAKLKVGSQACALAHCFRETYDLIPKVCRNVVVKTKTAGFRRVMMTLTSDDLDRWADEQRELEKYVEADYCNRDACAPTAGFQCDFFSYCHGTNEQREQLYQLRPTTRD